MVKGTGAVFVAWLASGCAKLDVGVVLTPSTLSTADPTVCELLARSREPRRFTDEPRPASGPGESAASSITAIGAGPSATAPHACVARLERDARPMLAAASENRAFGAPRVAMLELRAVQPAALSSDARRLARLPLESLRRGPLALGPGCRL